MRLWSDEARQIALKLTDAGLGLDHADEWVSEVIAAAVQAERDRLLARIEALAERLSGYDCLEAPDDVPLSVDVPDDYETGIHSAARDLRALIAEERAR